MSWFLFFKWFLYFKLRHLNHSIITRLLFLTYKSYVSITDCKHYMILNDKIYSHGADFHQRLVIIDLILKNFKNSAIETSLLNIFGEHIK